MNIICVVSALRCGYLTIDNNLGFTSFTYEAYKIYLDNNLLFCF